MTFKEYFNDWLLVIDNQDLKNIINKLSIEYQNKHICPNQNVVFKAFNLCQYKDLKIVMIGQDPYPQDNIATGILFGNNKNKDNNKLSPSLNIIKEAVINFEVPHNFINFDPSLENWTKQGILMINSALTVERNKIGSHIMLWRPFISKLLKNLSIYNTGIIYVLFGKQAQTFKPYINNKFNYIFEIEHPSYYVRTNKKMSSKLFEDINKKIKELYNINIQWYSELT